MTIFVAGATGATGRLLVEQLLMAGLKVRTVVRVPENLPREIRNHEHLSVIRGAILDLSDAEMARQVDGCEAVASCLGHNLNFKGMFGQPRRLVTDAVRRLCEAVKAGKPHQPVRFVLMNTTGNSNRDLRERVSLGDRSAIGLLRALLPPVRDNEAAAEYLRSEIGQVDPAVEWTAVRPDSLIDEARVTEYEVHPSPIRGVIFDSGKTSRINVAHFMAALIQNDDIWNMWKGQMPVIYNKSP